MTQVLYIEHNEDNLYMLKMRLELLGDFEVTLAGDGERAARWLLPRGLIDRRQFDILCQFRLPVSLPCTH